MSELERLLLELKQIVEDLCGDESPNVRVSGNNLRVSLNEMIAEVEWMNASLDS